MVNRIAAAFVTASLLGSQLLPSVALADNQMGYQSFTADQANALPKGGGKLGLNVGRAQHITSGGMTFELLRVNGVTSGSPGDKAGFRVGDQIIAVDGKVFTNVAAFAAYIGSKRPDDRISVDYMPPKGGPKDAQRVDVTLTGSGATSASKPSEPQSAGLSTGTKLAIGVGAAALFGCYKLGCFSHRGTPAPSTR
ncbi:PDZ domain-containing protein [Lichenihabitans sp. Uapishka_5]|uniref:PDZ domain-containing protein n=1 Tax=Lichenihabitans sp. Uapishka_5 TaxID=3037302 RepID=UPI0029E8162A|nr:PDZ domain-containing protein [Lichenihabitans sp. Uapishka_5]MDX7951231.1 PDZ domain-containing protein [Lichenihabitans sp. Uapishka_5]